MTTDVKKRNKDRCVYCETCGTCLICDGEDGCYDYVKKLALPSSAHVRPAPRIVEPVDYAIDASATVKRRTSADGLNAALASQGFAPIFAPNGTTVRSRNYATAILELVDEIAKLRVERAAWRDALDRSRRYITTAMRPQSIAAAASETAYERAERSGLQHALNALAAEFEKVAESDHGESREEFERDRFGETGDRLAESNRS